MAGTSIHGQTVPFSTDHYGDADDPMDTVIMRDGVLNNALALADEYAQVRANWMAVAGGLLGSKTGYLQQAAGHAADEWYRIAEIARWPAMLRADGTPYKVRIRIAGATNNASYTATFGAVLSQYPTHDSYIATAVDNVYVCDGTTSTTPVWLTGASQGAAASATMLSLASSREWDTTVATLDDVGGNPASVVQRIVSLTIYGQTTNASGEARLSGVYAAEYVG